MLIPKKDRLAIYEYLFKEGVCVARKDFYLMKHPVIGVPNLYVIKSMQSLLSRNYVKEQFAWRHYYWTLTNEGISYLRTFLNLPAEIVPATVRRPQKPDARGPVERAFGGPPGKMGEGDSRDMYRKGIDKTAEAGIGAGGMEMRGGFVGYISQFCMCIFYFQQNSCLQINEIVINCNGNAGGRFCPNLRLKLPRWVQMPSAMVVYALVLLSYFFVTGGVIYDIIIEPPSIGSTVDSKGHSRPVAFLPHRVNGQYIMEGLAASFMFVLGGIGFVVVHRANLPSATKSNRSMLLFFGIGCILISYIACTTFIRIKLPQF
ncbi:Oligosaccharyltransferase complex subunit OSTC, partial [Trichinella nelsoni]